MISSLTKLADKSFVVGYLTPFLAFALAVALCFDDLPLATSVRQALSSEKSLEDLVLLTALAWFSATLLQALNRPIYRALEGYWGPLKRGSARARLQAEHRRQRAALRELYRKSQAGDTAWGEELNRALERFRRRFPQDESDVLPTRFGNINRAFERYPERVYDVESIAIWSRLSGVIPDSYQAQLGDARSQVDGFVNLWFLALLFAALAISHFAFHLGALTSSGPLEARDFAALPWLDLIAGAPAGLGAARVAYALANDRAIALGDQVKAAFDLYLPKLPAQLGYELPATRQERKAFWDALANAYLRQAPAPERWRSPGPSPPPGKPHPRKRDPSRPPGPG